MATPAMAQEAPTLLNPVGATCVSSPFGPRAGQMHRGIDLPAPAGAWTAPAPATPISAPSRRISPRDAARWRWANDSAASAAPAPRAARTCISSCGAKASR